MTWKLSFCKGDRRYNRTQSWCTEVQGGVNIRRGESLSLKFLWLRNQDKTSRWKACCDKASVSWFYVEMPKECLVLQTACFFYIVCSYMSKITHDTLKKKKTLRSLRNGYTEGGGFSCFLWNPLTTDKLSPIYILDHKWKENRYQVQIPRCKAV